MLDIDTTDDGLSVVARRDNPDLAALSRRHRMGGGAEDIIIPALGEDYGPWIFPHEARDELVRIVADLEVEDSGALWFRDHDEARTPWHDRDY